VWSSPATLVPRPRCGDRRQRRTDHPSGDQGVPAGELRTPTGLRIVAALWVVGFHFHFTALPVVAAVDRVLGPLVNQARWASTCSSSSPVS
jgi:hypothetical protein